MDTFLNNVDILRLKDSLINGMGKYFNIVLIGVLGRFNYGAGSLVWLGPWPPILDFGGFSGRASNPSSNPGRRTNGLKF